MVLQCADASARQMQLPGHSWCGDGQRQLREGRGTAAPGAGQQYLLARQQPGGVFSPTVDRDHVTGRGAGGNFAAVSVEDAHASVWEVEDAGGAVGGGVVSLPLAATVCWKADEASLEIRREQPHQWRSSESAAHGQPATGAMPPENSTKAGMGRDGGLGPCSFVATHLLTQHPPPQQQLQDHYGNVMSSYPLATEQQRYGPIIGIDDGNYHNARSIAPAMDDPGNGAKAVANYCSGGLGFGGGDWAGGITGGQMGACSPKSSISSDGSGGDMVGNSPAAVWEVGMRRGASKGGGGGASAGGGRKRALDAADEDVVGLWQPHMVRSSSESSARLHDNEQVSAQKQSIDPIKQLFLCANMEVESSFASDEAEIRNKEEKLKQLLQLLTITSLERDEARVQLQRLLNKVAQPSPLEQSPTHFLPDLLSTARARCSLESPSRTHSHPYAPSSMESLFDPVSPQELPHKIMPVSSNSTMAAQQQAPLPECTSSMPPASAEFDPTSAIIDRLVLKRALPEKGKLLQAVMEAGPLLQTLLVAGSLPRWRNPPPLQPFQIPPVSVTGRESGVLNQNVALNQNYLVQTSPKSFQHHNPLVASQIYTASSPGSSGLGAFVLRGSTPSTSPGSYQGSVGKRQKF